MDNSTMSKFLQHPKFLSTTLPSKSIFLRMLYLDETKKNMQKKKKYQEYMKLNFSYYDDYNKFQLKSIY